MKALNRKEALVNAKANGTLDDFKPLTREEAFTKKALELGGGDVAWEDIKNRPFGEEVETVSVECDYYNNGSTNTLDIDIPLVLGNVYQIEISKDGEVFDAVSCTAYETTIMNTSAIVLGNAELANGTGGNGESVMIAYAPSHNAYVGAIDGELGDYHIKVTTSVARIKTIDPKYLPSGGSGGDNSLFVITGEFHATNQTGDYDVRHDQTYEEILEAYNDNKILVFCEKYEGEINAYFFLSSTGLSDSDALLFYFTNVLRPAGTPVLLSVTIAPDNDSFMTETVLVAQ